jgi:hypothetical protein
MKGLKLLVISMKDEMPTRDFELAGPRQKQKVMSLHYIAYGLAKATSGGGVDKVMETIKEYVEGGPSAPSASASAFKVDKREKAQEARKKIAVDLLSDVVGNVMADYKKPAPAGGKKSTR